MTSSDVLWVTSRAAGVTALLLSSGAVAVGLTMGGKLVRGKGPDLRAIHESLALATLLALVVHVTSLLFDTYFHPSIADLTIPFAMNYKVPFMAAGIIAGWMLMLLGLSYYFRTQIGNARWKKLHRFTALAWLLGIVHTLGEGTDAGAGWFLAMVAITTIPPLCLLAWRMAGPQRQRLTSPRAT
jgi:sulfoxide reductase heme-binding subunit YedZ